MRTILVLALVAALPVAGCVARQSGGATATQAAEALYVACAQEHGITLTEVTMGAGTVEIVPAAGQTRAAVAEMVSVCEPRAIARLTEGGPAPGPSGGSGASDLGEIPPGVSTVADYVAHLREQGFAGVLSVERDGRITTAEALGDADPDTATANTMDTAFDIGSIAKSFTAAAVLGLADDGELALDDTLGELLPDVPADKRDITVLQLLDFSSGLGEYHDTAGDFEPMSRAGALRRILDQQLRFAPGTDTAYSNSSYTLAAIVVEQVTGRAFTAVVEDLFAAAGLRRTGFYGSAALQDVPVATGYRGDTHGRNSPASWELTWALLGGGGIASTADDLHRWWDALLAPDLLRTASRRLLTGAIVPVQTVAGVEGRGVAGANDFGFEAIIVDPVARGTVIVVLSNANPPDRTMAGDAGIVLARLTGGADGDGR